MATKLLQSIVSGDSSRAEGIKMSKELAQHYIDWVRTSPFGKKNGNLPLAMLVKASFNWGIERGLDSKLKGELSKLKQTTTESVEEATTSSAPGEWVAYLSMARGKKLLKTFDTARGAKQFLSKNVDKLLGGANVESVGIMTKKQWDVGEAKYAVESVNEEDTKSPEETLASLKQMAMGDLERIEDYAEMISDRMKEGQDLSAWMYSQITLAVDQLNAVHDTMDGKDGIKESVNEAKLIEPKDDWGVRLVVAINNNVSSLHTAVIKEKQDVNKAVEVFGSVLKNAIKETLKHKYKPHPKAKDADNQIKTFISELKKFESIVDMLIDKPTKAGITKLDDAWRSIWNHKYGAKIGLSGELFNSIIEGKKAFKVNPGIGSSKYSISSHDGVKNIKMEVIFGILRFLRTK